MTFDLLPSPRLGHVCNSSLIISEINFVTNRSDWRSTSLHVNILFSGKFCINKISWDSQK